MHDGDPSSDDDTRDLYRRMLRDLGSALGAEIDRRVAPLEHRVHAMEILERHKLVGLVVDADLRKIIREAESGLWEPWRWGEELGCGQETITILLTQYAQRLAS